MGLAGRAYCDGVIRRTRAPPGEGVRVLRSTRRTRAPPGSVVGGPRPGASVDSPDTGSTGIGGRRAPSLRANAPYCACTRWGFGCLRHQSAAWRLRNGHVRPRATRRNRGGALGRRVGLRSGGRSDTPVGSGQALGWRVCSSPRKPLDLMPLGLGGWPRVGGSASLGRSAAPGCGDPELTTTPRERRQRQLTVGPLEIPSYEEIPS